MLELAVVAQNAFNYDEPVTVGYDIYSPQGKLLDFNIREVVIPGRMTDTVRFNPFIYGTNANKWEPGAKNPPLYKVMLFTRRDGAYREYMPLKIGFGKTEFTDGRITRFDKEIKLVKARYNAAADHRALAAAPAKVENAAGPDTSDTRTNSALSTENRAIPAAADAEVARTDGEPSTERLTALAAPWRYTVRDGKKIGEHNGAHFYTIGQRKGLGIGGRRESLFILATDTAQNVIYVGEGDAHPGLWRPALHIAPGEIHWVNPARTLSPGQSARFSVRIRYRQPLQDATLFVRDEGAYILFDQPQRGITPGQFAAWYDGDELAGSGVISE